MFFLLFHDAFLGKHSGMRRPTRTRALFLQTLCNSTECLSALGFCPPSPDCSSSTEQYSTTACYGYRLVTESQLCASHCGDKIWDQMNIYMEQNTLFFWSATFTTRVYSHIHIYLVLVLIKANIFKNYPRPPAIIRTVNSQKVWTGNDRGMFKSWLSPPLVSVTWESLFAFLELLESLKFPHL